MTRDDPPEELRAFFFQLIKLVNECPGLKGGKARKAVLKEAWKNFESYTRTSNYSDLVQCTEKLSEFIMR